MAELSVDLAARLDKLEKDLKYGISLMESYGDAAVRQSDRAAGAFNATRKTTAKTLPVLQEFSRIIEDAPFGIIGVGNNITQLSQSFAVLSRTAGGPIAAFRLLIPALAGPGGLIIAISSVVSLLTVFSGRLRKTGTEVDEFKEKLEAINKQANFNLGVNESERKILELQGQSLVAILLTRKQILLTQLSSIENMIKEEQEANRLAKAEAERLSAFEAVLNLQKDVLIGIGAIALKLGKIAIEELFGDYEKMIDVLSGGITIDQSNVEPTKQEIKEIEESTERLKALDAERKKVLADILALQEQINTRIEQEFRGNQKIVEQTRGFADTFPNITTQITAPFVQLGKVLSDAQLAYIEFATAVRDTLATQLEPALKTLGTVIGQELAKGANLFKAISTGLSVAFAQFLSQMGDLLIKYGALAVAKGQIDKAIVIGGKFAIAAGIAAIAVGTLLKAAGSAIAQKAQGGFTGDGGSFERSDTFTGSYGSASFQGYGGGTVTFLISGQNLVGVLQRTLEGNKRVSGSIGL